MSSELRRVGTWLTGNWQLKLLSVVLGAITYYVIRGATSFEAPYDIPVHVQVDPGTAVYNQDPLMARVTFRGSQEDLRRIDQRHIAIVVKPDTHDPGGEMWANIGPKNVQGVAGVQVISIEPPAVRLKLDRETVKVVPLSPPKTTGKPLLGRAEVVAFEPKSVTVRGPRRRLQNQNFDELVSIETVDVDGRVESFEKRVRVLYPDEWISSIEPGEIKVRVEIATQTATNRWKKTPVLLLKQPGSFLDASVEPESVDVILEGRSEKIESISEEGVRVFVDGQGLAPGVSYELPVVVHLPQGVDVKARVEPRVVTVRCRPASDLPISETRTRHGEQ